jgi:hypothetical protein
MDFQTRELSMNDAGNMQCKEPESGEVDKRKCGKRNKVGFFLVF